MKTITLSLSASILCIASGYSASTSFILINPGSSTAVQDASGTALTSGTAVQGTGSIIHLGYFDGGSIADGIGWTAIAGLGSLNSSIDMRVGDFGTGVSSDGYFSTTAIFDGSENGLPAADTQLAIRIFDSVTEGALASANFNTVTNTVWKYTLPADSPPTNDAFQLNDPAAGVIIWQDNANAFKTSISAVPEPSSFALLGLGGMALLFRRRK